MTAAFALIAAMNSMAAPASGADSQVSKACSALAKVVSKGDEIISSGASGPNAKAWLKRATAIASCGDPLLEAALNAQMKLVEAAHAQPAPTSPPDPPSKPGEVKPAPATEVPRRRHSGHGGKKETAPGPPLEEALHQAANAVAVWLPLVVAGGRKLTEASPLELRRMALLLGRYLQQASRPKAPASAFGDLARLLEPVTWPADTASSEVERMATAAVAAGQVEFSEEDLRALPAGLGKLIKEKRGTKEIVRYLKSHDLDEPHQVDMLQTTTRVAEVRRILQGITGAGASILIDTEAVPEQPSYGAVPLRELVRQRALLALKDAPPQIRLFDSGPSCPRTRGSEGPACDVTLTLSVTPAAKAAPAVQLRLSVRLRSGWERAASVTPGEGRGDDAGAVAEQTAALVAAGLHEIEFYVRGRDDAAPDLAARPAGEPRPKCSVPQPHTAALAPVRLVRTPLQESKLGDLSAALAEELPRHLGTQLVEDKGRQLPKELWVRLEMVAGDTTLNLSLVPASGDRTYALLTVPVRASGLFGPADAIASEATLCFTRAIAIPSATPPTPATTAHDYAGWAFLTPGLPFVLDSNPANDGTARWLSGIDIGLWLLAAGAGAAAAHERKAYSVGDQPSLTGTNMLLGVAAGAAASALLLRGAVALGLALEDAPR